jgi:hypothetical protein
MFPTGSKLLLGGAVLAIVAAIVYGVTQGGSLGTVGLISAAVALSFLAGINIYTHDADVSAMDTAALTESAAANPPPGRSVWPLVGAFGGLLVTVGLVTYQPIFIFGLITIGAATVEWMVQAWSERASGDRVYNDTVRDRIAHPLEFPLLAAVGVLVLVYSFSRIMLFLSKTNGPAVFGAIAALLLVVGFVIAFRPSMRTGAIGGIAVVAAVGLITGGVTAALGGEREIHAEETTSTLAAEGKCDTPDETEADHNASQDVAATANLTAIITLQEDGTLIAKNLGVTGDQETVVVTRATNTNVRFVNDSAEPRRLVLDLGTRPETDETGDTVPDTEVPDQQCTQLAEEGGSQLMTFSIATPTWAAASEYRFFVPGVDGADIAVEVP